MVRILISGASGFVGTPLSYFLRSQGHDVIPLVRPSERQPSSVVWDPQKGLARQEDFENFDAVIHLAGEPLTFARWSKEKQKAILTSRTIGTMFLSHLLSSVSSPPKVLLTASAIGYYGNRGDDTLTEQSPPGTGFLSHVCTSWEKACHSAQNRGIRVIHTRFGMVLGPNGGALQKMLPLYRLGLGAKLGSGRQWVSWVALHDLIQSIHHILTHSSIEGSVNVVSPNPVRQAEFSHLLAQLLHRPHFLSIPAWALRLRFGLMADELLLSSAKAEPAKLVASKFRFLYPDLRSALCKVLQII